jgi:hypothetical protein
MKWAFAHVHAERGDRLSSASPEQLLSRISILLSERAGHGGLKADERFGSYLADFKLRGDEAIESRGIWGRVSGLKFEIAAASGYRVHRWWIPKLTGVIEAEGSVALVRYRLRAIQLRHLLIIALLVLFGLCSVVVSANRFLSNAYVAGILALALGLVAIGSIGLFVRLAAPIAMRMEAYLNHTMDEVVGP